MAKYSVSHQMNAESGRFVAMTTVKDAQSSFRLKFRAEKL